MRLDGSIKIQWSTIVARSDGPNGPIDPDRSFRIGRSTFMVRSDGPNGPLNLDSRFKSDGPQRS